MEAPSDQYLSLSSPANPLRSCERTRPHLFRHWCLLEGEVLLQVEMLTLKELIPLHWKHRDTASCHTTA
eukprot:5329248-Amphidinium_carterae.1